MEKLNTDLILFDNNYYLKLIHWSQTIKRRELKSKESKEVLPDTLSFGHCAHYILVV